MKFWDLVISALKSKLSSWKGRFLSIGGRVTLLNSFLSNIPINQLSFYRILVKVMQEIIYIQRNFIWHGVADKRGLVWVSLETICKPGKFGGLGVKYIRKFNQTLLSNWIWRIVTEEDALWKGILQAR